MRRVVNEQGHTGKDAGVGASLHHQLFMFICIES